MLKDSKGYNYKIISRQGHLSILKSFDPAEYIVVRFLSIHDNNIIDMGRYGRWYFWDKNKAQELVKYLLKNEKELINFR